MLLKHAPRPLGPPRESRDTSMTAQLRQQAALAKMQRGVRKPGPGAEAAGAGEGSREHSAAFWGGGWHLA